MTAKKQHTILALLFTFVLCINLLNVQLVHADEGTPTEPPVPTQVETEPPTELPAEPTLEPTSIPIEVSPTPEILEATAAPEAVPQESTPTPVLSSPTLENTDIVVLDEQGQPLPLGSQETADALAGSDPVWCPDSVTVPTPGANGCSDSYGSITELLLAMQANPLSFSQNGTIFLEQTTGQGFATPLILDDSNTSLGAAFSSLSVFNLTLQGGWNPATGTTSDLTAFSGGAAYVQVGSLTNPWAGALTINNLAVLGSPTGQDAIQIFASNVALNNVTASYGDMNGISITASEAGTVSLTNVNASNNGNTNGSEPVGSGVYISGADTLVNVIGGAFINNARYGIEALNSTSSTLPVGNLWTDQQDYAPGSVVTISGNDNSLNGHNVGFVFGETVQVIVQGPNGYTATCEATADSYGSWSCQITLWAGPLAVGDYIYTATGLTSGVLVSGTFMDGPKIASVTVGSQTGTVTAGTAGSVTYSVTPVRGNNGTVNGQLSILSGLPATVTPSFSPSSTWTSNGNNAFPSFTLTLTTSAATPAGTYTFTVRAADGSDFADGTGTLTVGAGPASTPTNTPTNTATATQTATNATTNTPTNTPTNTATATQSPANTPTHTPTSTSTNAPTNTPTYTPTNTATATQIATNTLTATQTPTNVPTNTSAPTHTPTSTATSASTGSPTNTATATATPSQTPTNLPTNVPAITATATTVSSNPGTSQSPSSSSAFVIPLTGGKLIDLDCNSIFWMFGIKFTFFNLCDQQTSIHSVGARELPAKLPTGYTYVMGLDVDVLTNGQLLKNLPDGSGVEMDFPLYKQFRGTFVLLYWNDPDGDGVGEWIEISKQLDKNKILQTLTVESTVELYKLIPTGSNLSFQGLTTDKTGLFVLMKK